MRTGNCHILPYFHQLARLAITRQSPELLWTQAAYISLFKKNLFFYFSLNVRRVIFWAKIGFMPNFKFIGQLISQGHPSEVLQCNYNGEIGH